MIRQVAAGASRRPPGPASTRGASRTAVRWRARPAPRDAAPKNTTFAGGERGLNASSAVRPGALPVGRPVAMLKLRHGRGGSGLDTTLSLCGHPKSRRAEATWEVESLADPVTVPGGTFTCLRVRRSRKHHPPVVSWYAKGVLRGGPNPKRRRARDSVSTALLAAAATLTTFESMVTDGGLRCSC